MHRGLYKKAVHVGIRARVTPDSFVSLSLSLVVNFSRFLLSIQVIQQLQPSVVSLQCCSTRLDDIKFNEEDALRKLQISSVSLYLRMLLTTLLGVSHNNIFIDFLLKQ